MRFALDAATLAFGAWLPGERLLRAMRDDPYVLGYVLARLRGLTNHAAEDARLSDECGALNMLVLRAFLGEDAATLAGAASLKPAERERRMAGARDGSTHCDYLFERRDVREHPCYAEAVQRERSAAAAMPGNRFNGTPAAIAHHLEHFTFGAYFEREHPLVAPARVCHDAA